MVVVVAWRLGSSHFRGTSIAAASLCALPADFIQLGSQDAQGDPRRCEVASSIQSRFAPVACVDRSVAIFLPLNRGAWSAPALPVATSGSARPSGGRTDPTVARGRASPGLCAVEGSSVSAASASGTQAAFLARLVAEPVPGPLPRGWRRTPCYADCTDSCLGKVSLCACVHTGAYIVCVQPVAHQMSVVVCR